MVRYRVQKEGSLISPTFQKSMQKQFYKVYLTSPLCLDAASAVLEYLGTEIY